ncbi:hypothetical protein SRHO_G00190300 [Serrasalmus rhombeus]
MKGILQQAHVSSPSERKEGRSTRKPAAGEKAVQGHFACGKNKHQNLGVQAELKGTGEPPLRTATGPKVRVWKTSNEAARKENLPSKGLAAVLCQDPWV